MLVCDVDWQPGNAELLPSVQAEVFEEIATMDCPFEGIPTVPPRKDMDHMVAVCLCVHPTWSEGNGQQAVAEQPTAMCRCSSAVVAATE